MTLCSTDGCVRKVEYTTKGLCRACYKRLPDQRAKALLSEQAKAPDKNRRRRERYATDPQYAENQKKGTRQSANRRYKENEAWRTKRQSQCAEYRATPKGKKLKSEAGRVYKAEKKKDPAFRRRVSEESRRRNTGFTPDMVTACLCLQGGLCAVCRRTFSETSHTPGSMVADHYETSDGQRVRSGRPGATKHPRGILCSICNQALGMYEWHLRERGVEVPAFEAYLEDPPASRLPTTTLKTP